MGQSGRKEEREKEVAEREGGRGGASVGQVYEEIEVGRSQGALCLSILQLEVVLQVASKQLWK